MQKIYRKSDIHIPINKFEGKIRRLIRMPQELAEFQHMAYNLQLAEKNIDFPNAEVILWVNDIIKYKEIREDFEYFLTDLLDEQIKVKFAEGDKISSAAIQPLLEFQIDYLSFFSGGLDSIAVPFQDSFKEKSGVMHHTITHPSPYGKAKKIFNKFFKENKKMLFTTSFAENKVKDPSYLKTRGLIFLTNALCVATELKINEVVIPENGPFMINLPISYKADPTSTTEPEMISEWTKIFQKLTNSRIKVSTPFKNMTKSEVILSTGKKELISATWSCSYFQGRSKMCGICNSCLVRILSCYAIDEGENIEKFYSSNPFTVDKNDFGDRNLESYRISLDAFEFWTNIIEPEHLDEFEKQRFVSIRENYPIMINHSLDMILGFKKLTLSYNSKQPLFVRGQKLLKYIDNNVLEKRYQYLMKYKEEKVWG